MPTHQYRQSKRPFLFKPNYLALVLGVLIATPIYAQSLSYAEAEQQALKSSYSTQANQALQQASQLEAEAVKGLGLPRVDLNVRAYAFHSETDVPLGSFKQKLENDLSQGLNDKLSQWNNVIPSDVLGQVQEGSNQIIHDGINRFPNYANLTVEDQVVRPSISVVMPLYTGGLTTSAKKIANIQAQRSELSSQQQQDIQRFEVVQSYFNVQLQQQLVASSLFNFNAMQKHYSNALKLEQQGFISKGQRMQFEVARNNAERTLQNAQANLNASQFNLNNLLHQQNNADLSTPLFVNTVRSQSLESLLSSYSQKSSLVQKMQLDTQLANANIQAQQAAKKPSLFAFGEYSLDENENWIVGVMAKYNLFSGVDKNKNIHAAELKRYASELMTERTKQEIEALLNKSYNALNSAQQSHTLLQRNISAAQENLRIQELSFREGMGTATQVIDAQNALSALKTEMALNAYKYVMSLATLLQSHGSMDQFKAYVTQPHTDYIR
ncbi:TPA: TolC family protein [Acinetobacter baumannii]